MNTGRPGKLRQEAGDDRQSGEGAEEHRNRAFHGGGHSA
jgi:hypothetical protein